MILTSEWQPYDGNSQKRLEDIKLKNGDVVLKCWANAGFWNVMQKEGNGDYYGQIIPHTDAEFVRLNKYELPC